MLRKGLAVAVILLFIGVALTPTTYADVDKPELEVIEEDATPTPIVLVLQLITKLRNHKEIQNIEDDVELNGIIEELKSFDCGCEDEETTEGEYPIIICLILFVIFAVASNSSPFPVGPLVLISYGIAEKLNCPFTTVR